VGTIDGKQKRLETHPGVRTDHCNVWMGSFPNTHRAAHFMDHLLDDRIVDCAFDVGDHEYFVARRLKFPCRSDAGKVDVMIS
jgi:hypothetical protein